MIPSPIKFAAQAGSPRVASPQMALPLSRLLVAPLCVLYSISAFAAAPKTKKNEKEASDSAPVLMSKTAGGNLWSDVKELTAAANKGNPKAQAQLGEILLRGDPKYHVTQDRPRALTLLEQAARAGEASAAFRIGMLLDDGDGLVQDRTRALSYFRAAAGGGAKEAFFNIGAAYAGGRGVKPDIAEALGWFIVAGKHGADPTTEQALRTRIETQRRPELIARGEKRAQEIEADLGQRKVADLLPPPAPFAFVTATAALSAASPPAPKASGQSGTKGR